MGEVGRLPHERNLRRRALHRPYPCQCTPLLFSPPGKGLTFLGAQIPSNLAGRTKRTVVSSITFIGYCTGNMVGSQVFKAKDAPRYTPGVIGCSCCFGILFFVIQLWRYWRVPFADACRGPR